MKGFARIGDTSFVLSKNGIMIAMAAVALVAALFAVVIGAAGDSDGSDTFTYDELNYKITSGSEVMLVAGAYHDNVVIPSYVEYSNISYKVTAIDDDTFYDLTDVFSVTIPKTVSHIGTESFVDCVSLLRIDVEDGNPNYNSINGVLFSKGTLFRYPSSNLASSYTVPDGITSIGDNAFLGAAGLDEIILSKSVAAISDTAFISCVGLKRITVPEGNEFYTSDNGVLFNKNKTELLCCPANIKVSSYTVPDTVTKIHSNAFNGSQYFSSVNLGKNISSIGNKAFCAMKLLSQINVDPENVNYCSDIGVLFNKNKSVLIQYPVSATGAVYNIPDTVSTIGSYSFYGTTLSNIVIPDGVEIIEEGAFKKSGLASVSLPNSVKTIGPDAFNQSKLSAIAIGSGVTSIGNDALFGCNSLSSITVDSNNTEFSSIDGVLFDKGAVTLLKYPSSKSGDTYTIPDTVTVIEKYSFNTCLNLTTLIIPDNVIVIKDHAFIRCIKLTSVTMGSGLKEIGSAAFSHCSYLSTLNIGENVETIGDKAFYYTRINSITIPASVTSIGNQAFSWNSCTSFTVDGGNQYYSSQNGVLFDKDATVLISYPAGKTDTSYIIPDTIKEIADGAFYKCINLKTVTIPNGVVSIGMNAFYNCSELTGISIPASVESIGSFAFFGCNKISEFTVDSQNSDYCAVNGVLFDKGMTDLLLYPAGKTDTVYAIPDTVEHIGASAFHSAVNLSEITIPENLTSIDSKAFAYSGLTSLIVPGKLDYIGIEAFNNTFALETVVFSDEVNLIASGAFKLSGYNYIILHGNNVPSLGHGAFFGDAGRYVQYEYFSGYSVSWAPYINYLRPSVDIPTANILTYNGELQTGVESKIGAYDAVGNTAINAGSYSATLTLINGIYWFDTTQDVKNIPWSISCKEVLVKANNNWKHCGEHDPDLTATVTGLVGNDTIIYTLARATGEEIGTYTITSSGDATQGNYTVTYEAGTFKIEKNLSPFIEAMWAIPLALFVILFCTFVYGSIKKN